MKSILLSGEDMSQRCQENEACRLRQKLVHLRSTMNDTWTKASRVKVVRFSSTKCLFEVFHDLKPYSFGDFLSTTVALHVIVYFSPDKTGGTSEECGKL